ncbi:MAG: DUF5711 family protein [Bacillota bacterium]
MKTKIRKKKMSVFLVLLLGILIVFSVLFAFGLEFRWWSFGNNIIDVDSKLDISSKIKEFSIGYGNQTNLVSVDGYLVSENDGIIEWRNQNGDIEQKSESKMLRPILRSSKKYLVIAEAKGKKFEVYLKKNLSWKGETEEEILNVNISDNGFLTVIKKYTGYTSAVDVYNEAGIKIFTSFYADLLATDALVLPNNKTTIINLVKYKGTVLKTIVEYLDSAGKKFSEISFDDELAVKILSLADAQSVICTKDKLVIVSETGKEKFDRRYKSIQSVYEISKGILAISAVSKGEVESQPKSIQFLNSNNEFQNSLMVNTSIKSMIAREGVVVLNLGRRILILNQHGQTKGGSPIGGEIDRILFLELGKAMFATNKSIGVCSY